MEVISAYEYRQGLATRLTNHESHSAIPSTLSAFFMTPIRLIAISLLLFLFKHSNGQNSTEHLDSIVNSFVKRLNAKGIDTVCLYQDYCIGCLYIWKKDEDKCNFQGLYMPTYIIWKDKGQSFMTKKDNCFDYSTVKVKADSLWQFFFTHRDTIQKEEIKMPQYIENKNGKQEIFYSSINHSRHQRIQILVGRDTIVNKDLDDYFFSKEIGFKQHKNINYDYNINSHLKNLQLIISRMISAANKRKVLTKTRR